MQGTQKARCMLLLAQPSKFEGSVLGCINQSMKGKTSISIVNPSQFDEICLFVRSKSEIESIVRI